MRINYVKLLFMQISHSYREGNNYADTLVNVGCPLRRDILFYNACPLFLSSLMLEDNFMITTFRLISL
jgi:hypothetical protein